MQLKEFDSFTIWAIVNHMFSIQFYPNTRHSLAGKQEENLCCRLQSWLLYLGFCHCSYKHTNMSLKWPHSSHARACCPASSHIVNEQFAKLAGFPPSGRLNPFVAHLEKRFASEKKGKKTILEQIMVWKQNKDVL